MLSSESRMDFRALSPVDVPDFVIDEDDIPFFPTTDNGIPNQPRREASSFEPNVLTEAVLQDPYRDRHVFGELIPQEPNLDNASTDHTPNVVVPQGSERDPDFSDEDILDEHVLGEVTLDESLLNTPFNANPSMLQLRVPAGTEPVSRFPEFHWSPIEYPVQAIILKSLTDELGSFQKACYQLQLSRREVEEFLSRHTKEQKSSHYTISEAHLYYGCKYLRFRRLGAYSSLVHVLARNIHSWPPNIDYNDLNLSVMGELSGLWGPSVDLPSHSQVERARAEKIRDLTTRGVFRPAADSIAVKLRVGREFDDKGGYQAVSAVTSFRLPAGIIVLSRFGKYKLVESGLYRVVYDRPFPDIRNSCELIICDNAPKHPELVTPEDLEYEYSETEFFDDAVSAVSGGQQAAREASSELRAASSCSNRFSTSVQWNTGPAAPAGYAEPQDEDPTQDITSISLGPQLLLQPRIDARGPIPHTKDLRTANLSRQGYRPLIQLRLPDGYYIISPSGHKMTFDSGTKSDGTSPTGRGGVFIAIQPDQVPGADIYKKTTMDKTDMFLTTFDEPMAVFRNGVMLSLLLQEGLHRFSMQQGNLKISCKDGIYDLHRILGAPEPRMGTSAVAQRPDIYDEHIQGIILALSLGHQNIGRQDGVRNSEDGDEIGIQGNNNGDRPNSPNNTAAALKGPVRNRKRKRSGSSSKAVRMEKRLKTQSETQAETQPKAKSKTKPKTQPKKIVVKKEEPKKVASKEGAPKKEVPKKMVPKKTALKETPKTQPKNKQQKTQPTQERNGFEEGSLVDALPQTVTTESEATVPRPNIATHDVAETLPRIIAGTTDTTDHSPKEASHEHIKQQNDPANPSQTETLVQNRGQPPVKQQNRSSARIRARSSAQNSEPAPIATPDQPNDQTQPKKKPLIRIVLKKNTNTHTSFSEEPNANHSTESGKQPATNTEPRRASTGSSQTLAQRQVEAQPGPQERTAEGDQKALGLTETLEQPLPGPGLNVATRAASLVQQEQATPSSQPQTAPSSQKKPQLRIRLSLPSRRSARLASDQPEE